MTTLVVEPLDREMERQFVTIVQEIQSTDSDAVNIPLADILSYKGTHNGLGYRDVMVIVVAADRDSEGKLTEISKREIKRGLRELHERLQRTASRPCWFGRVLASLFSSFGSSSASTISACSTRSSSYLTGAQSSAESASTQSASAGSTSGGSTSAAAAGSDHQSAAGSTSAVLRRRKAEGM